MSYGDICFFNISVSILDKYDCTLCLFLQVNKVNASGVVHSYSFSFHVTSIETIRIVQNFVFGVDRGYPFTTVLHWDLNQDLIRSDDRKGFFSWEKVLRVANSCSVVAIQGE